MRRLILLLVVAAVMALIMAVTAASAFAAEGSPYTGYANCVVYAANQTGCDHIPIFGTL